MTSRSKWGKLDPTSPCQAPVTFTSIYTNPRPLYKAREVGALYRIEQAIPVAKFRCREDGHYVQFSGYLYGK